MRSSIPPLRQKPSLPCLIWTWEKEANEKGGNKREEVRKKRERKGTEGQKGKEN
jgi:hypothetical protein